MVEWSAPHYTDVWFRRVGRSSILCVTRRELDLTCQSQVNEFISRNKPDTVILAAKWVELKLTDHFLTNFFTII